jgi:hypothetical protein
MKRSRQAFKAQLGSVGYVAVTYDQTGRDLPRAIHGNEVSWTHIKASEGEILALVSSADMERDLHELGVRITQTVTVPRTRWERSG